MANEPHGPPRERPRRPDPARRNVRPPVACVLVLDADLPFEQRVERAWARLLARFEEDEHERLRELLLERIDGERRGDTGTT